MQQTRCDDVVAVPLAVHAELSVFGSSQVWFSFPTFCLLQSVFMHNLRLIDPSITFFQCLLIPKVSVVEVCCSVENNRCGRQNFTVGKIPNYRKYGRVVK